MFSVITIWWAKCLCILFNLSSYQQLTNLNVLFFIIYNHNFIGWISRIEVRHDLLMDTLTSWLLCFFCVDVSMYNNQFPRSSFPRIQIKLKYHKQHALRLRWVRRTSNRQHLQSLHNLANEAVNGNIEQHTFNICIVCIIYLFIFLSS